MMYHGKGMLLILHPWWNRGPDIVALTGAVRQPRPTIENDQARLTP